MTAVGVALVAILVWPKIAEVWTTGVFDDPDDAMRLVEVRALLAGQGWYDMTAHGLNPPQGVFMHWSRVLDVQLGLIIRGFAAFVPMEQSERLTRLLFPLAWTGCLLLVTSRLARLLAGPLAVFPAVLMVVGTGVVFGQFAPGHIHHHAAQIVLLIGLVAATLSALDTECSNAAILAGALAALSLSIGLEDLPYVIIVMTVFPLAWTFRSGDDGAALGYLALGFSVGLILLFVATIAPARYLIGACDAFSSAHMVAGLATSSAFVAMWGLSGRLTTWPNRLPASITAGLAVLAVVALTYPACLGDPLAEIDPFMREIWLSNVQEARPLVTVLAQWPSLFPMLVLPVLFGILASLMAAASQRGLAQTRWFALIVFLSAGVAAAFWQIRALAALAVLAVLGGAFLVARGVERFANVQPVLHAPLCLVLSLPFCAIFWALILPPSANSVEEGKAAGTRTCQEPQNLALLNGLPPGLVLAPINAGSHILAHTHHEVVAAPYHRNVRGNRLAVDAFLVTPAAARDLVLASGAVYLVECPAQPQMQLFADRAPHGLAAALLAEQIPAWLQPLALPGSQFKAFAIGRAAPDERPSAGPTPQ